jgi:hypothetical protein
MSFGFGGFGQNNQSSGFGTGTGSGFGAGTNTGGGRSFPFPFSDAPCVSSAYSQLPPSYSCPRLFPISTTGAPNSDPGWCHAQGEKYHHNNLRRAIKNHLRIILDALATPQQDKECKGFFESKSL